jgi:mannose-6-phosphate isomerase-like protein (cupin superfamily)
LKLKRSRDHFKILHATRSVQAALMSLAPGGVSDEEPSNEHPQSEQWVYVVSGSGEAKVGKKRNALRKVTLGAGSLLLIEKRELHQIRNTGLFALVTLNFYSPPAYDLEGNPRSRASHRSRRR